ncbi:hypothetical protein [Jatrophihabitans endophyticus]|uniref:hypothetical protein n=1 Tax=Jatrophihabitans endophyticus TaxID=1206085 RepID=UPI001A068939|nr:hypothetical protein [Jatrophihabitans endophyticus]MBE7190615.1 hypothetical protein [Jatrophihabitans endophyticus]
MTTIAATGYQFQLFMRTAGGAVNWRLLSGNNREAGRGAVAFSDVEQCRAAIEDLRVHEAELVGRVRRTDDNRWTWQLLHDDRIVAVASKAADRMIRAESALQIFRASLAEASIRPSIVLTESRRWRTVGR